MKFDELNDETYILFAIKHYENPHCVTREDFDEDVKSMPVFVTIASQFNDPGANYLYKAIIDKFSEKG